MTAINTKQIMNKDIVPWFSLHTLLLMLILGLLVYMVWEILCISWLIDGIDSRVSKIDSSVADIQNILEEWLIIEIIE